MTNDKQKFITNTTISITITLNIEGKVEKSEVSDVLLGTEKTTKSSVCLLVSEKGHLGFGVAFKTKKEGQAIIQKDDAKEMETWLKRLKANISKREKEDLEEKKKKEESRKQKIQKLQNNDKKLFHNETILYAQPVERHYSPMERVTYGMDKLELEDVTFKF